jgi:hypothetical protein
MPYGNCSDRRKFGTDAPGSHYGHQHPFLRRCQPVFPFTLSFQDVQLLAQEHNFKILLIGSDANGGEHIQNQIDQKVEQCEDRHFP